MSKPLSPAQLDFLRSTRDKTRPQVGSSRGLVQRGMLSYIWANNPSYGYKITLTGLEALRKANR